MNADPMFTVQVSAQPSAIKQRVSAVQEDTVFTVQVPHKPKQEHSGCQRCRRPRCLFTVQVSAQASATTQRLSTVQEAPMFIYSASVCTSLSNHTAAVNGAREPDVYLQCNCPRNLQQSQRLSAVHEDLMFTVKVSAQASAFTHRLSTVHEDPMFIYSASVRTNVGNHTAVVSSARGPDVYSASVRTSLSNHTPTVNGAQGPDVYLR